MADNVALPASGVSALTDDCGSGHAQRVKIDSGGVDGAFTDTSPSAPLPVKAGVTVTLSSNFNRPADTNVYAAGDLVANSTTAGSVVIPSIVNAVRQAGGGGHLLKAKLRKTNNSITNASFRVHFATAAPSSITNGDNGVLSVSGAADYRGSMDITLDRQLTDGAVGFGIPAVGNSIPLDLPGSNTTLFWWLEARAAYTPASGETFTLDVDIQQD